MTLCTSSMGWPVGTRPHAAQNREQRVDCLYEFGEHLPVRDIRALGEPVAAVQRNAVAAAFEMHVCSIGSWWRHV